MAVLKNIGYLATCKGEGGQGDLHPVHDAAIAWRDGTIEWVGRERNLPGEYSGENVFDAEGKMVIPGLVDCHTHLVFGGWRPEEFVMRVQGQSYLEIGKAGGGILSTVAATRKASGEELYKKAYGFLKDAARLGVTVVECKSGYGLTVEDELKILRVYQRLAKDQPLHIVPTFLGAHAIPPEFKEDREGYIDLVVEKMIPAVAEDNLAEFCDVFTEESAFTVEESRRILVAAQAVGLTPKLHADQLTPCGGAELAARLEAASADHLENISGAGIKAMAEAGVVGVLLPLASLYTQQQPLNGRTLLDGGLEVAIGSDFNPGSAPCFDLPLAMMLACNQSRLTPAEALKGATFCAAGAIRRARKVGSVEKGKSADFAVIDAPDPTFWMYHFQAGNCVMTVCKGEVVFKQ